MKYTVIKIAVGVLFVDKQHPDGNLDDGILHSEPPFLFGSFGYPSYPLLYKFFSGL